MMNDTAAISRIAATLWKPLAAYAWQQYQSRGRGIVLAHVSVLTEAHDNLQQTGSEPAVTDLHYVPGDYVPPGDDFLPLIREYDPHTELLLLIGLQSGDDDDDNGAGGTNAGTREGAEATAEHELLLRLQAGDKPPPPQCAPSDSHP